MRVQVFVIAILLGIFSWIGFYHLSKTAYQEGQAIGVVPNLRIKERLGISEPQQDR